jgi:hypothetical protein
MAVMLERKEVFLMKAVNNNPDKFPEGYIIDITKDEYQFLKSKISTLKELGRGQHIKCDFARRPQ